MTTLAPTPTSARQAPDDDPWGTRLVVSSLVALPVVTAAIMLVLPADASSRSTDAAGATKALVAATDHRAGVWIGLMLVGLLYLLLLPALQAVLRVVTGRGRALVRIGYVLSCVGACALAIEDAVIGVTLRAATTPGLSRPGMVTYLVDLQKEKGPLSPLLWLSLPMFVGIVVMALGVLRSPSLRWWHAALLVVSVFGLLAASPGFAGIVVCAVLVALAAAFIRELNVRQATDAL
jgi:hypothetical protein